jgi:divalent metal cation (Fe/Co/Zn/Cd) transporter
MDALEAYGFASAVDFLAEKRVGPTLRLARRVAHRNYRWGHPLSVGAVIHAEAHVQEELEGG